MTSFSGMNTLRRGVLGSLEERMLAANPLLEAFGNAVTVERTLFRFVLFVYLSITLIIYLFQKARNKNSSRFGKLTKGFRERKAFFKFCCEIYYFFSVLSKWQINWSCIRSKEKNISTILSLIR